MSTDITEQPPVGVETENIDDVRDEQVATQLLLAYIDKLEQRFPNVQFHVFGIKLGFIPKAQDTHATTTPGTP